MARNKRRVTQVVTKKGWSLSRLCLLALMATIGVTGYFFYKQMHNTKPRPVKKLDLGLLPSYISQRDRKILTARGRRTYGELDKKVFRKFGLQIAKHGYPYPDLEFANGCECKKVFKGFLETAAKPQPEFDPQNDVPEDQYEEYLMFGYAAKQRQVRDDIYSSLAKKWDANWLKEQMAKTPRQIAGYYPDGSVYLLLSLYHAMQKHLLPNGTGIVIGSLSPWVEIFSLWAGAKKVVTVEYQAIETQHPSLHYENPLALALNFTKHVNQYDFAVSFSTIEHSGLGRYGDAMDPIGDLREAQKVLCFLKPGGLFFLAAPVGMDKLVFNIRRVYGRVRLPMVFTGFDVLAVYEGDDQEAVTVTRQRLEVDTDLNNAPHLLFVLRKRFQPDQ